MATTKCAYGCYEPLMPPAPAHAVMGSSTLAMMESSSSFNDDGRSHAVVVSPTPVPPPGPPAPLLGHHSGARSSPDSSKATTYRHLGLCTEGLGSESSETSGGDCDLGNVVDADDTGKDDVGEALHDCKRQYRDERTALPLPTPPTRTGGGRAFPPPLSVIGAAGKPWQYLRAHRGDGRLVLREVRIPSQELLQACREDGRLMLHFADLDE